MSRNGSGTYVLPVGNPVVTGTTITSNWANTTFSDVATALTGSVAADGQTPMTGPLAMGGNKITGVANGTISTDVATFGQLSNPNITGGSIDGTPIGNISPSTGKLTTLDVSSGATLAGTCTAPTVTPGSDNTTKIATTAFVQSAISAISSGVTSFNTRTGVVTLTSGDVTGALGYTPYDAGGTTVINTGNIGTYAPSTTGSGASGNWAINITGNAATVTNGVYTTGTQSITGAKTFTSLTSGGATAVTMGSAAPSGAGINCQSYNFISTKSIYYNSGGSNTPVVISNGTGQFVFDNTGAAYNNTGTWGNSSDVRVKENIAPARNYLSDLCKLNVVNYSFKSEKSSVPTKLGFIAQDVEKIMPGLISSSEQEGYTDFKSIKTSVLIPMLVQAVQELKLGLDAAKAEIAALKG